MEMYKHQTRIFVTKAAKKHKNLEKKERVETLGIKGNVEVLFKYEGRSREVRGYIEREKGMSKEHTEWKQKYIHHSNTLSEIK